MARDPVSQGDAPLGGVDAETLARISKLEDDTKHNKKSLDFVGDTNKFILVVLFIGVIGLLVAIIVFGISEISSDRASRDELNSQVQQLNYELQHSTAIPSK